MLYALLCPFSNDPVAVPMRLIPAINFFQCFLTQQFVQVCSGLYFGLLPSGNQSV